MRDYPPGCCRSTREHVPPECSCGLLTRQHPPLYRMFTHAWGSRPSRQEAGRLAQGRSRCGHPPGPQPAISRRGEPRRSAGRRVGPSGHRSSGFGRLLRPTDDPAAAQPLAEGASTPAASSNVHVPEPSTPTSVYVAPGVTSPRSSTNPLTPARRTSSTIPPCSGLACPPNSRDRRRRCMQGWEVDAGAAAGVVYPTRPASAARLSVVRGSTATPSTPSAAPPSTSTANRWNRLCRHNAAILLDGTPRAPRPGHIYVPGTLYGAVLKRTAKDTPPPTAARPQRPTVVARRFAERCRDHRVGEVGGEDFRLTVGCRLASDHRDSRPFARPNRGRGTTASSTGSSGPGGRCTDGGVARRCLCAAVALSARPLREVLARRPPRPSCRSSGNEVKYAATARA